MILSCQHRDGSCSAGRYGNKNTGLLGSPVFLVSLLILVALSAGCIRKTAIVTPEVRAATATPSPPAVTSSPVTTATPVFKDVAGASGLAYRWQIAGKRPINLLQGIGNGCAFLDYNGDGNLDILLVGQRLALFQGNGKGQFRDLSKKVGLNSFADHFLGCAVGDYDNDGYDDIYVSGYRTGLLLHNERGHRFRDVTATTGLKPQPWGTSCAFADIDHDGFLDLYVANYVVFRPGVDPLLCDAHGFRIVCGPAEYKAERGVLYHNRFGRRFEDATRTRGADKASGKALGVAFADFDNSGAESLAVANDEMPGDLFRDQGGKFVNIGVASGTAFGANGKVHGGMGVDWGDYDNDGRLDLFVATFQSEIKSLYHNDGEGVFTDRSPELGLNAAVPYVAFGTKFLDFDNDGWLDLLIANGHVQDNIAEVGAIWGNTPGNSYRQPVQLFQGQQGKRFTHVPELLEEAVRRPIVGRGLAVGDYDNDGRMDALVVDAEGTPLLLHNDAPTSGSWLSLKLVGTRSNRGGIGALVTVRAKDGGTWTRRCGTDGSYLSASDQRVHFGLGIANRVSVTVRWPSGAKVEYGPFATRQFLVLREAPAKASSQMFQGR